MLTSGCNGGRLRGLKPREIGRCGPWIAPSTVVMEGSRLLSDQTGVGGWGEGASIAVAERGGGGRTGQG